MEDVSTHFILKFSLVLSVILRQPSSTSVDSTLQHTNNHIEYIIEGTDYFWHDQNSWSVRSGGLSRRWRDLSRFTYDLGFQVCWSVHWWGLYQAYTYDVGHSYVGHIVQLHVHACTNAGACYPFNYSVFQFVILSARLLLHVYIFFKHFLSVHCSHPYLFVRYWWWPKEINIISMCNITVLIHILFIFIQHKLQCFSLFLL